MGIALLDENELTEWFLQGESMSDDELKGAMFRLIGYGMLPDGVSEEDPRVHNFILRCARINKVEPPAWVVGYNDRTTTGRLSSSEPNPVSLPKANHSPVLHCLDADEGEG